VQFLSAVDILPTCGRLEYYQRGICIVSHGQNPSWEKMNFKSEEYSEWRVKRRGNGASYVGVMLWCSDGPIVYVRDSGEEFVEAGWIICE